MANAIIDEVLLNNHLEKLICLTEMQKENINNLNKNFNKITETYKTDNTNKIKELNNIEEQNLKIINKDSEKYIKTINHTINKYKNTAIKVSNIFKELGEE